MVEFFTKHISEIASFIAIVGSLWAIIAYSYRKLDKKIDVAFAKIDAQGERIDAMGVRIDAMGTRIDHLYNVMMTMLQKQKD